MNENIQNPYPATEQEKKEAADSLVEMPAQIQKKQWVPTEHESDKPLARWTKEIGDKMRAVWNDSNLSNEEMTERTTAILATFLETEEGYLMNEDLL